MSMPGTIQTGPEPFPMPGETPNPTEVPTNPVPIEDPSPRPDVIDPGVDMPPPGQQPEISGGPMVV